MTPVQFNAYPAITPITRGFQGAVPSFGQAAQDVVQFSSKAPETNTQPAPQFGNLLAAPATFSRFLGSLMGSAHSARTSDSAELQKFEGYAEAMRFMGNDRHQTYYQNALTLLA